MRAKLVAGLAFIPASLRSLLNGRRFSACGLAMALFVKLRLLTWSRSMSPNAIKHRLPPILSQCRH